MKQLVIATVIAFIPTISLAGDCQPEDELRLLALTMYHEARGDGIDAKQLVGEVVLSRVESENFPDNVCDVITQDGQFSYLTELSDLTPKEDKRWEEALYLAEDMLNYEFEPILSQKATHFLNPKGVSKMPNWTKVFQVVGRYGGHVFYNDGSV